ncbi:MAG TPA: SLC13 family permease [Streptosporangiaceae bacterium]|nr:SLC13 family permease [Streptosporangiaceae bacterium]
MGRVRQAGEEVGLSTGVAETVSVLMLLTALAAAVIRPWGWPEAVIAVPAAALVVVTGAISPVRALDMMKRLGPVIGFLAAVLILAQLCQEEGLFRALGDWLARLAKPGRARSSIRLLAGVFAVASVVTAVLSLDATVVLLTPVVFAAAARSGARPKPYVYGCTHLANSASLLLPVSNLTNLIAFAASGLSFTRFAALMAVPWLAAVGVEYLVFRQFFRTDLNAPPAPAPAAPAALGARVPVLVVVVLAATLAGFAATSLAGINPAWAAAAGALALAARALLRRGTTPREIWRAADVPFLLFVLALGVVVAAVTGNGLAGVLQRVMPSGSTWLALLATAALAAAAANMINNLPAVLVLLPLAAPAGAGAVLAVLIGVNIGPNLTYAGSLATLLWRRVLREHDAEPDIGEFTRLGLLTVPAALLVAVTALWAGLTVIGG